MRPRRRRRHQKRREQSESVADEHAVRKRKSASNEQRDRREQQEYKEEIGRVRRGVQVSARVVNRARSARRIVLSRPICNAVRLGDVGRHFSGIAGHAAVS
jgi:hypothetical protein